MPTAPDLSFESEHEGVVAGVDEAGRGPLVGPVVAAAAILDRARIPQGIADSKLLTPKRREFLYDLLCERTVYAVALATVEEIEWLNILGATKLAMQRAVEALTVRPNVALVDGNQPPALPCATRAIVGGDRLCLSIAAASILAKVTRDRMMRELALEYPGYGWERNMGYGTEEHLRALDTLGATIHHRKGFAPVRAALERRAAA